VIQAAERDEAARAEWRRGVAALPSHDFVFVDESSTSIAMTRRYARAPRGKRAKGTVPRNHGKPTSLISALGTDGLGATMTVEGAVDGSAFSVYLRDLLCPTLKPGQTVVLDNLNVHKLKVVRPLIEKAGCKLLYLPSYSPDFSPIEHAFSKIKQSLRGAAARTQAALDQAITNAINEVTKDDALGWFRHCGYLVSLT